MVDSIILVKKGAKFCWKSLTLFDDPKYFVNCNLNKNFPKKGRKEEILGKKNGENLERKELLAFSLTIAPGTSLSS